MRHRGGYTTGYSDLMRRPHKGKAWPVWWYDPRSGDLLRPSRDDRALILDCPESIAPLLTMIAPRGAEGSSVVYLAAGDSAETAPDETWYKSAALDDWEVEYRGGSPKDRSAIMRRGASEIHVRHVAVWFTGDPHLRLARSAYDMLGKRLVREFGKDGDSIILYGTPAQTGLMLLDVSLPRDKNGAPYRYPVLSDANAEMIEGVAFQHHREMVIRPGEMAGYSVYDARLSYAAYLRDVPMGEPIRERTDAYALYRPGWYRVTVDVPPDWRYPGLAKDLRQGDWPRAGRFDTWMSEPELRLLRKTPGWTAQIHERIYWPERRAGGDPLREWGERLTRMYISAELVADAQLSRMLKGAVRHLIHDTLGSFKRSQAYRSVTVPHGAPFDPSTVVSQGPYGHECHIPMKISNDRMRYYQPQIAGHIWARNRANLATFALGLNPEEIIALETDAVHLAFYAGYRKREPVNIGAYRLKGTIEGPLPRPMDWSDLRSYAQHAETIYTSMYDHLYGEGRALDG